MATIPIRKQATLFLVIMIAYTSVYPFLGFTRLLEFSFLEPSLMEASRFTQGYVNDSLRWQHFALWLPANSFGFYACLAGLYATYICHQGQFFTARFARGLFHVGVGVSLSGLFDIIATVLTPYHLSSLNPNGPLPFRLNFSPEECGLVLCGVAMIALAQMMAEATRIADENESFV